MSEAVKPTIDEILQMDRKNFRKWATTASEEELDTICRVLSERTSISHTIHDYRRGMWGKNLEIGERIGQFLRNATMFCSSKVSAGDFILNYVTFLGDSKPTLTKFFILSVERMNDPNDMYFLVMCTKERYSDNEQPPVTQTPVAFLKIPAPERLS